MFLLFCLSLPLTKTAWLFVPLPIKAVRFFITTLMHGFGSFCTNAARFFDPLPIYNYGMVCSSRSKAAWFFGPLVPFVQMRHDFLIPSLFTITVWFVHPVRNHKSSTVFGPLPIYKI